MANPVPGGATTQELRPQPICLPPPAVRLLSELCLEVLPRAFGSRMGPSPGKRSGWDAHRFPGCRVMLEEGVGELHGDTFPVVRILVLRDAEEHGGRVGGCRDGQQPQLLLPRSIRAPKAPLGQCQRVPRTAWQHSPVPSFRECSSSIRGAEAPSASMASAASLSWASSHSTPAATRWMFSTGEYRSCQDRSAAV